jgi:hypothetical protein
MLLPAEDSVVAIIEYNMFDTYERKYVYLRYNSEGEIISEFERNGHYLISAEVHTSNSIIIIEEEE